MAKEAFGERQAQDLKLELFKKVHLFEDLSNEELKDALKYMQIRTFRRNEYLFFEEEAEPGVYILIDGLIKLLKETHDARIVIVRLVYPGDVFGWIEWGKKAPKNTYTAKAMVDSKTLYISNKDFINLAIKHPAIAIKMTCEATSTLLHSYETLKSIAGGKVEERIAKVLLEIAELVELQRSYTNINKAIVWFGGDIVSGLIHDELIKSADITAVEQVAVAGYLLAQVVAELSTVFDHIEVITTVGNHGRLAKRKEYKFSVLENFDYIAYQICALALRKYRNVKFNISKAIFRFEDIAGWRFVFSHGDETRSWMSIPFYGLKRDFANKNILNAYLAGLQTQVQPVNYKVVGHFHISGFIPEGGGYIIMNGTLKGIDEYAFTHGWITRPSQIIFGVHQEYGITWNYSIWLDVVKKENPSRFVVDLPDTWADLVI